MVVADQVEILREYIFCYHKMYKPRHVMSMHQVHRGPCCFYSSFSFKKVRWVSDGVHKPAWPDDGSAAPEPLEGGFQLNQQLACSGCAFLT